MDTAAYSMGFILSRASYAMRQHVNRTLRDSELSHVSMGFIGIILSLHEKDGQTISELGEAVSLEKSTMTGVIERMVRAGLVTRKPDPDDGRASRVYLTEDGRKTRTGIEKALKDTYRDLTRGVSRADIEKMQSLLTTMVENSKSGG